MVYIVYLTTNQVNQKIYIGKHKTENPDVFDDYLGDGVFRNKPTSYNKGTTPFQAAVRKYGPGNFIRKTLKVFDTEAEALAFEAQLVDSEFIKRIDTYNIVLGGGNPPLLNKPIYQYDLTGKLIKEWSSIHSITQHYKINKDRIRMCINDRRSFDACYWSETKHINIKDYRSSFRGVIRQYTTSGVFLNQFKNTSAAAKALDIDREKITNAIYGKYATSGYWFLKEDESIESYLDGTIKKAQKVYCYGEDGSFLSEFKSLSEVKSIYKVNKNELKRACKKHALLNGFYWSFSKYDNILKEDPEITKTSPQQVYQYTMNGEFVKCWDSITACKKEFPAVLQVLLGNRTHCHKFKFSFNKPMIQSDTLSNKG